MNFKIFLLVASALLMGACGTEETVENQAATVENESPDYVYSDEAEQNAATAETEMQLQTDTSDPYEDVVEQGNVDNDLDVSNEETTGTLQNPEEGMPEDDTTGRTPQ